MLDWNTADIDWHGRGWDRGLRGIAIDGEQVYVAASNRLLAFTPDFEPIDSWHCPFLQHCHEIFAWKRTLYLTSTAFDSILGFDLDQRSFHWAMHVQSAHYRFKGAAFDPASGDGPLRMNKLGVNSVSCSQHGMYLAGARTGGMLHFNGTDVRMSATLPADTSNAQPFRDGVLFNDTGNDRLRYTGRGDGSEDRAMSPPDLDRDTLSHLDAERERYARPGYARGLCVLSDRIVAGGSAPACITIYDLAENQVLGSIHLSTDIRNTIHTICGWPFD